MTHPTITLGAVRMTAEPDVGIDGTVRVAMRGIYSTGDDIATFYLYEAEWQSLLAVAAVVEAAQVVKEMDLCESGMGHGIQATPAALGDLLVKLYAALDALPGTGKDK